MLYQILEAVEIYSRLVFLVAIAAATIVDRRK